MIGFRGNGRACQAFCALKAPDKSLNLIQLVMSERNCSGRAAYAKYTNQHDAGYFSVASVADFLLGAVGQFSYPRTPAHTRREAKPLRPGSEGGRWKTGPLRSMGAPEFPHDGLLPGRHRHSMEALVEGDFRPEHGRQPEGESRRTLPSARAAEGGRVRHSQNCADP